MGSVFTPLWRVLRVYLDASRIKALAFWEATVDVMESAYLVYNAESESGPVSCWGRTKRALKRIFVTIINACYWLCCCRFLRLKCCWSQQIPAKISVLEANPRRPVTGQIRELYSDRVRFSIDEMLSPSYGKVLLVLDYAHLARGEASYSQANMQSPVSMIEGFQKRGFDVMVLYTGLPKQYICSPWRMYNVPQSILNHILVSQLLVWERFLTLSEGDRLNASQDWRFLRWTQEILLQSVSVVGFSTKTRSSVIGMLKEQVSSLHPIQVIDSIHLAKDDDFKPAELRPKVLLLCSYTERDNIMVPRPDVGELTGVYEKVEDENVDAIIMYAGVVTEKAYLSENELFSSDFMRLLKSQPKLQGLMDRACFLTVSNNYKLNRTQLNRLVEWLTPSNMM